MNWQTAHDDRTRNATIKELKDYLQTLTSSLEPEIIEGGVSEAADDVIWRLDGILETLGGIRDALARIDRNNDGGGE